MPEILISIIVPVYNVEPYLHRCIDSILAQTYTNFECILIDDGSTDNSGHICDEYATRDKRIKVIHHQNNGVSAARNAGLNIADGDYIGFVDPDDWISTYMYAIMSEAAEKTKADVICCAYDINNDHGITRDVYNKQIAGLTDRDGFVQNILCIPHTFSPSVCNKIYKKDLVTHSFRVGVKVSEDGLFNVENAEKLESCFYIPEPLYHVYIRNGSATRTSRNNAVNALEIHEEIIGIAKEYSNNCYHQAAACYLDCCMQNIDDDFAKTRMRRYLYRNFFSFLVNPFIPVKLKIIYCLNLK